MVSLLRSRRYVSTQIRYDYYVYAGGAKVLGLCSGICKILFMVYAKIFVLGLWQRELSQSWSCPFLQTLRGQFQKLSLNNEYHSIDIQYA